jgi:hypothetical protein
MHMQLDVAHIMNTRNTQTASYGTLALKTSVRVVPIRATNFKCVCPRAGSTRRRIVRSCVKLKATRCPNNLRRNEPRLRDHCLRVVEKYAENRRECNPVLF